MKSLALIQTSEETPGDVAYNVGYEIGYFVGSNLYEIAAVAFLVLIAILYFAFFRKKKNRAV